MAVAQLIRHPPLVSLPPIPIIVIGTANYTIDDDRLLTGAGAYSYDSDGFLSTKTDGANVTTYDYSSRGKLLGGRVVEYVHDSLAEGSPR